MLIESVRGIIRESKGLPLQALEKILSGDPSDARGVLAKEHKMLLTELSLIGLDWVVEDELEGVLSYIRTEPADKWERL